MSAHSSCSRLSSHKYISYIITFFSKYTDYIFSNQNNSMEDTTKDQESLNKFTSKSIKISFADYVSRVVLHSDCSPECLIYCILIIQRLERKIGYFLNKGNMFLFFFICYYISIKLLDDDIFSIDIYSKISGVKESKIIDLENTLLEMIDYKIYFTFEEFSSIAGILLD